MATESVSIQMREILDEFSEKVEDVTKESMNAVAKEAVQQLKATSPKSSKHRRKYAEGWTTKKQGDDTVIVHNRTNYQLTHLLENGHVVRPTPTHPNRKGRVAGIKHIKPVEEWANEEFQLRISRGLS